MAQLRDQVALTAARIDSVAPDTFGAPPETRVEMPTHCEPPDMLRERRDCARGRPT
jgi:hypothetical protein